MNLSAILLDSIDATGYSLQSSLCACNTNHESSPCAFCSLTLSLICTYKENKDTGTLEELLSACHENDDSSLPQKASQVYDTRK